MITAVEAIASSNGNIVSFTLGLWWTARGAKCMTFDLGWLLSSFYKVTKSRIIDHPWLENIPRNNKYTQSCGTNSFRCILMASSEWDEMELERRRCRAKTLVGNKETKRFDKDLAL